ncbi:MAG: hypothetical protein BA862_11015 [Desulfobulbaceae bacterium S3730MH12]|nr:MAG: hypothetical protein BA866_08395 [Desulfobulbaceae bacterium S5133MH15]OEU57860.1 MAG: hypothetical protein BA862_11015 [Desulfobulbaceae bacterium S3730MH12]OEU84414.1 MAG: hypothetical protein BA873_08765 [Desulfobulbaceae bacterium C00003063]
MSGLNAQTEKLLSISVEQYRELLQHAEKLLQTLDNCNYSEIPGHADKLQRLQNAASRQDKMLLPLFRDDPPAWEENTLYRKRQQFIKSILKLNKLLMPKIRGTMAVTTSELNKLRGGRTALAGYTSHSTTHRGVRGVG